MKEPKDCIQQTIKALYREQVVVKRADGGWVVSGELVEDDPGTITVLGDQYTVNIDLVDIRQVCVTVGFRPIIKLRESGAGQ